MKKRNVLSLALAAAMVLSLFAGCSGGGDTQSAAGESQAQSAGTESEAAQPQETVNIKIHCMNADQTDFDEVMEQLRAYTKDKINVTPEYVYHGGSYADKIQTIIASGEEYDACFTSNWLNPYNTNVSKGAFIDIKDLIPEVAPKLLEVIPEYMWTAATINGGVYAIPNQQIVARQIGCLMPKDYVEGTGTDLSTIHNLTDLGEYAQKAYDQYGAKLGGVNRTQAADYCGYEYVSDYMAAGAIKMDDESAKVVNFYATDEWKAMLNELVDLNEKGLLDGECGYMDEYAESQRLAKKTSGYWSGTYKPGVEEEESARAGYDCVMATIDTPPYISTGSVVATMYAVSVTSKHPEETLKYFELLNTDPNVMNMLTFGIEGKHYEKTGENSVKLADNSGYYCQSWGFGNVFLTYTIEGQSDDVWEQTKELNDSAKQSPILGFSFDPEPVKNEITNVSKVVKEYESLVGGELPVEETNAEFLEKLSVAGVDTVIEEMQRQIDEFMASK